VTLCEILNILEPYPLKDLGFHSARSVHFVTEAMRYAYADRNAQLGDPNFVTNPTYLIAKDYAADIRKQIQEYRATPSSEIKKLGPAHESVQTTHYSIVDVKGNAVAVSLTLNSYFGSKVIPGDTGFFLNNTMDDFTLKLGAPNQFGLVQGEKNFIQPGKRALSAMTPTIITKNAKVFMVLGSPGGSTIITSVLQTFLNVVEYGMDIQAAVDAPRIHMQFLPDAIWFEPFALSADTKENLAVMGYNFTEFPLWGAVEAVLVDPLTSLLYGGSDSRRSAGAAVGY